MKIKKIINNNAVFSNVNERDAIITGPGIGWKKEVGSEIDSRLVEKIYISQNQSLNYLERLFQSTDLKYFKLAEAIRIQAEKELSVKITDQFIFSLADHFSHAVKRYREGLTVPNLILNEIRLLYSKEYQVAKYGLEYINKKLDISLPDDEVGYIALHIINCCFSTADKNISEVLVCTKNISDIVQKHLGEKIDTNSYDYYKFLMHLKVLARKIVNDEKILNFGIEALKPMLMEQNGSIEKIINEIDSYIYDTFEYKITAEEDVYLFIHILRITHGECDFK